MESALQIRSITGVDVELPVAGPGGRSFAFIIDWHIRTLLALAWYVVGTVALLGSLDLEAAGVSRHGYTFAVVLPAAAIYFFYHPVLELAMQGRTPGKRMAGVRIVTGTGAVPGTGAILIRNVLRLVDSLPGVYAVGLAATVFSRQSVRIGDMAAGTLLIYEDDGVGDTFKRLKSDSIARVGLSNVQLVEEVLDRWAELDSAKRTDLGRRLLERLGEPDPRSEADVEAALKRIAGR
ncbi:MAG: RDD family protein [Pseudomonadales bacterium]|jgi:uncharacterized RDD family membrane protein YckC